MPNEREIAEAVAALKRAHGYQLNTWDCDPQTVEEIELALCYLGHDIRENEE